MPRENGIEIHLLERCPAILDLRSRHDRHAFGQRFGFFAPVRFDDADDDFGALLQLLLCGLQHGVGLPDARRHAEKNLELAARRGSLRASYARESHPDLAGPVRSYVGILRHLTV